MLLISGIFGDFTGDVVHHMLGLDHVTPRQALPIQGFQERMGENTAFQIIGFPGGFGGSAGQKIQKAPGVSRSQLQQLTVDEILDLGGQIRCFRPDPARVAQIRDENAPLGVSQPQID